MGRKQLKAERERLASIPDSESRVILFTAERYGLAVPTNLSDTAEVDKLRCGVTLPPDAFVQHYMGWRRMPEEWQDRFRGLL